VRALTRGPVHHWFGCYDKTPWSPDGRHLLAMESSFADRMPRPGDRIRLGLIDAGGSGRFEPFAETQAWCWQTGCMLQWLPGTARTVTYNVREEGRFAAVVHNLDSGARRVLPRPVFCLTPCPLMKASNLCAMNDEPLSVTRKGIFSSGPCIRSASARANSKAFVTSRAL
jgi:hypothetical protein